jgi:hypothetical protein
VEKMRELKRRRQGTIGGEKVGGKSCRLKEDESTWGCSDFKGALGERWCFGWKFGFIENNIAGKVYFMRLGIKALVATLIDTIAEKYARFASEG